MLECNQTSWSLGVYFLTKSPMLGSLPSILTGEDRMSAEIIRPKSLNSIPNSFQIHSKVCEIIGADVFPFSHPCNLNQGHGHLE